MCPLSCEAILNDFFGVGCLLELVVNVFFLMNGCKNQLVHELKFEFRVLFLLRSLLGLIIRLTIDP